MDALLNAGKELLEQQISGSNSQGMYRTIVIIVIAIAIAIIIHTVQTPNHTFNTRQSEANTFRQSNRKRPSPPRKQSVPHHFHPHVSRAYNPDFRFHIEAYGGNYPAGGDFYHDDEELRTAHQQASQHAGSSGNSDLFSNIINTIGQKKSNLANSDIDEQDAIRKHKETYEQDNDNLDSSSLGSAAALQALKKFTQGETGGNQSQGAFLGLAMSEASKLFDSKAANGKVSSDASKESAIQQAGEMALKMYFKSQGGGQGGSSGLLGIASKFF
ncbi:beta-flanking [Trichoderma arundinaceum]|uniref:Beta-flanking n=1 Tax=Trichoderma arundinaceum TaxID=490622 RepID=A0A395NHQ4_TRIAR|nr:beta-flanking [Trichoderma arundinaceum]